MQIFADECLRIFKCFYLKISNKTMHLGDKLKLYRRSKDLDQVQTAELLGISTRTYQDIEKTGIVKRVTYLNAIRKLLADETKQEDDNKQEIADQDIQIEQPLSRTEVSDLIRTNRMQAEAILNLSRNISSPKGGKASLPVPPAGIGSANPYREQKLSGKRKQGDVDQG